MLYITLLDQFHPGIYSSQVIDVCNYLNKKHNAKIRLVAFLSIKELYRSDAKKKIKQLSPNALVLPEFLAFVAAFSIVGRHRRTRALMNQWFT